MTTILEPKIFIPLVILVAIVLLVALNRFKRWRSARQYARVQLRRASISAAEICQRMSIDESNAELVAIIRKSLAKNRLFNPNRIYPDDRYSNIFNFNPGDSLTGPALELFCDDYEFAEEDFKSVGDVIKLLIEVTSESALISRKS